MKREAMPSSLHIDQAPSPGVWFEADTAAAAKKSYSRWMLWTDGSLTLPWAILQTVENGTPDPLAIARWGIALARR